MGVRQTRTYATLEISKVAYDEIAGKLRAAGYDHVFMRNGAIDMHGIAVVNYVEHAPDPNYSPIISDMPLMCSRCGCIRGRVCGDDNCPDIYS